MLPVVPWLWPHRAADRRLLAAQTGLTLPEPVLGQVLLVTASDRSADIWAVGVDHHAGSAPFGVQAVQAWQDARSALSRSAKLLWASPALAATPSTAIRIAGLPRSTGSDGVSVAGVPDSVLEGPSFGLAFFLAIASQSFGVPVRASVVATAEINADGLVRPVRALHDKLTAVVDLAPSVRHVLVADGQVEEARSILAGLGATHVRVKGVKRAWDAVRSALSVSPTDVLRQAESEPKRRAAIVEGLFALTVVGREAMVDWTPVAHTCAALRTSGSSLRWRRLGRDARWLLQFAEAVASRHEGRAKTLPKWSSVVFAERSAAERLSILANYVQHASDTGQPIPIEVGRQIRRSLPVSNQMLPDHARVLGALARYTAVRGKPRDALRLQWRALNLFYRAGRHSHHEISNQCSEIYRLAGALGDLAEVRQLDQFLVHAFGRQWPFDELGRAYVRLARAQADVVLHRSPAAEPELIALMNLGSAADHTRSSALRWLVRALDDLGRSEEADRHLAETPFRDRVHGVLVLVDRAVRVSRWSEALRAVTHLRRVDPGPMRHLLAVAPRAQAARARFIQRFYPY